MGATARVRPALIISLLLAGGLLAGCGVTTTPVEEPGFTTPGAFLDQHADQVAGVAFAELADGQMQTPLYYGFSNIATGLKVDDETVFEWGSISKLVVWVSVMQLVEQGKLSLDADIAAYLPADFKWDKPTKPVTLTNLMNHTGGWADSVWYLFETDPTTLPDLRTALERAHPKALFEPGTTLAYSNYGATLAGYIVERVSGVPYWQYARDHVYLPAGMTDTTVEPTQADRPDIKQRRDSESGYDTARKEIGNQRAYDGMYPCGATIGTLTDLARFAAGLMPPAGDPGPYFSSRATLDRLFTPTFNMPDGTPAIAHGFFSSFRGSNLYWWHNGSTTAYSSMLMIDRETRRGVVVLTNTAHETVATSGLTLWCSRDGGQVSLLSTTGQFNRMSTPAYWIQLGLLALVFVSTLVSAVTLIASGLRKLIRHPAPMALRRWRNAASGVLVLFGANAAIMSARLLAPAADLVWTHYLPHFIIDAAIPFATIGYAYAVIRTIRMSESTWREKVLATGAGLGLLLGSAAVIVLNLWR